MQHIDNSGIFELLQFTERFNKPGTLEKYELFNEYFGPVKTNSSRREEALQNFARINVYVADSNVVKTEESPDYSGSDVISDIGGRSHWLE